MEIVDYQEAKVTENVQESAADKRTKAEEFLSNGFWTKKHKRNDGSGLKKKFVWLHLPHNALYWQTRNRKINLLLEKVYLWDK